MTEPTEPDLQALFVAMMALEPEFRGVPGWRLSQLARKLAEGVSDPPSREDVAAALLYVNERARQRNDTERTERDDNDGNAPRPTSPAGA